MTEVIAQIIGFTAVGLYLLSYQLKKRTHIVWATFVSNVLYVLQYFLLGAFSGAVMDIFSTVSSFLAAKKNQPDIKKYAKLIVTASVVIIVVIGLVIAVSRRDFIELLPIGGTVFQVIGLWCDNEQTIRKFGLISVPLWLIYNFICRAYGAAIGSIFVIVSIIISLVRYRKDKRKNTDE